MQSFLVYNLNFPVQTSQVLNGSNMIKLTGFTLRYGFVFSIASMIFYFVLVFFFFFFSTYFAYCLCSFVVLFDIIFSIISYCLTSDKFVDSRQTTSDESESFFGFVVCFRCWIFDSITSCVLLWRALKIVSFRRHWELSLAQLNY